MHANSEVANGPTDQEIVRSAWQLADPGGNDRGLDLAWAAGFFDGEGHVGIHRSRVRRNDGQATYSLQLSLAQIDRRLAARFQSVMGGQLRRYAITQSGNRAPFKTVWYAWGQEASRVLVAMLPYLVGKREQAEIAIAFQRTKKSNERPSRIPTSDEQIAWQRSQSDALKMLREQIKANS